MVMEKFTDMFKVSIQKTNPGGRDRWGQTAGDRLKISERLGFTSTLENMGTTRWPGAGPLSQQERWENEGGNTGKMFNLGSDTRSVPRE